MSNNQYNNGLYDTYISKSQFVALFCALLKLQGINHFQRNNMIHFIAICMKHGKFQRILKGILAKNENSSLDFKTFDQALSALRQKRLIHMDIEEQNPTVYISPRIPIKRIINSKIDYLEEMSNFMKAYQIFDQNGWIGFTQIGTTQDDIDTNNAISTLQKIIKQNKQ